MFRYFGSKWAASRYYPKPEYGHIIEPFAGSAGYSHRYPDLKVTLVEKDPVVYGVWHYLLNASDADILHLPDIKAGQSTLDLQIPQEARDLIGFWVSVGVSTPRRKLSKWYTQYPSKLHWGSRARRRIVNQRRRISHWVLVHGEFTDIASQEATWFIDPPYQIAGKHYKYGNTLDYDFLGFWCENIPLGQVIVCEGEGAEWLPFRDMGEFKSVRGKSKERIWIGD